MSTYDGSILRDSRRAAGLTQADLAARAEVSRSQIAMIESGRAGITPAIAARFNQSLGWSITVARRTLLLDICGTTNKYQAGCRCAECRAANTDRLALLKAERISAGKEPPVHGIGGYGNYGCRCPVCTSANTAASREKRSRRRNGR